uniref:Secreted protein n=1 Tax=Rhipicephalus appendiculatus TaxID=34631 RepID=A0A131YI40_RHIAP
MKIRVCFVLCCSVQSLVCFSSTFCFERNRCFSENTFTLLACNMRPGPVAECAREHRLVVNREVTLIALVCREVTLATLPRTFNWKLGNGSIDVLRTASFCCPWAQQRSNLLSVPQRGALALCSPLLQPPLSRWARW